MPVFQAPLMMASAQTMPSYQATASAAYQAPTTPWYCDPSTFGFGQAAQMAYIQATMPVMQQSQSAASQYTHASASAAQQQEETPVPKKFFGFPPLPVEVLLKIPKWMDNNLKDRVEQSRWYQGMKQFCPSYTDSQLAAIWHSEAQQDFVKLCNSDWIEQHKTPVSKRGIEFERSAAAAAAAEPIDDDDSKFWKEDCKWKMESGDERVNESDLADFLRSKIDVCWDFNSRRDCRRKKCRWKHERLFFKVPFAVSEPQFVVVSHPLQVPGGIQVYLQSAKRSE
jgi:hypothetical protein